MVGPLTFYNTNEPYVTSDKYSLLANYVGHNPNIFTCPVDAYFVSPDQAKVGWNHRVRSDAMNAAFGDGDKYDVSQFGGGWKNPFFFIERAQPPFIAPVRAIAGFLPMNTRTALTMKSCTFRPTSPPCLLNFPAISMAAPVGWLLPTAIRKFTNGLGRS